jgi:arylsulfatase A-like enzyme
MNVKTTIFLGLLGNNIRNYFQIKNFIMLNRFNYLLVFVFIGQASSFVSFAQTKPNIVIIYTDDLGFGDISANGAKKIKTPNIDRLSKEGLRFNNAYATAATCTPSRFSLLTGKYAWRKSGTNVAPGDAALIIPTDVETMPAMLQKVGYQTGVVGKWHLGLGPAGGPDWNADIKPGPLEIGFNYSFIMPATGDRVHCFYLENHRIVDLDPSDPIRVSYKEKIGNEPTGKENPELLKMNYSHGHDATIINGVSRIGWMSGGKKARWIDEDMADVFTNRALTFVEKNAKNPFFLFFATHDIHVPRVPHSRFVGKSGMGARGDAILQLDWSVGEILKTLDRLKITDETLIIFTSDNGAVVDDGYEDEAVEKLNGHTPSGILRGGKYSAFEGGTKVPMLVRWPSRVKSGSVSNALFSQIDFYASLAALTGRTTLATDSFNSLNTLLGGKENREFIIQQAVNSRLGIIQGDWKYIPAGPGAAINKQVNIELGNDLKPQLYNLKKDAGEKNNVAEQNPDIVNKLMKKLAEVTGS